MNLHDDPPILVEGIPLYRCPACGKQHLTWTGPWTSTRPTVCPCGEPFDPAVCDQWRGASLDRGRYSSLYSLAVMAPVGVEHLRLVDVRP